MVAEGFKFTKDQLALRNPGRFISREQEYGVAIFNNLGGSMRRAVLLQALVGWTIDRYFEASTAGMSALGKARIDAGFPPPPPRFHQLVSTPWLCITR